ncbi:hypothetical protein GF319_07690 [Candidatus Bathyarchaeota archaeon]|nr:hypothetical protein [Candidatus Bathyarchaeota archaeon]
MSYFEDLTLGRGISVEMKQRYHVKNLLVSEEARGQVLFEASLGDIIELNMLDNRVLEVKSFNGVLRVDLFIEELEEMINKSHSRKASGSKLGSQISSDKKEKRKNE